MQNSKSGDKRDGAMRQSNLELLRIVAMFMVMALHADFAAFGIPDTWAPTPEGRTIINSRVFIEMLSAVSVNAFVLISGWFGIRTSLRGICKFLFQCFFFFTITYLWWFIKSPHPVFTWADAGTCFALGTSNWFVKAYLGLMIVAPLLNIFCQRASSKLLGTTVIGFIIYQAIWGWIGPNTSVNNGYSAFSFIGLYLLAQYLHRYGKRIARWKYLLIYLGCCILNTVLFFRPWGGMSAVSYANPLNIIGAAALFLWFATLQMRTSKIINFVAASAFATYLLHTAPKIMSMYLEDVRAAYNSHSGLAGVVTIIFVMVTFYIVAILLDRVRILIWFLIIKLIQNSRFNHKLLTKRL